MPCLSYALLFISLACVFASFSAAQRLPVQFFYLSFYPTRVARRPWESGGWGEGGGSIGHGRRIGGVRAYLIRSGWAFLLPFTFHRGRVSPRRRMNSQFLLQYSCAPLLQTLVEPRLNFCLHFPT